MKVTIVLVLIFISNQLVAQKDFKSDFWYGGLSFNKYIYGLTPFDIYAYFWARKYTKNKTVKSSRKSFSKMLENSYILRLILEYVPVINFLPISTLFVLSVWYENENKNEEKSVHNLQI